MQKCHVILALTGLMTVIYSSQSKSFGVCVDPSTCYCVAPIQFEGEILLTNKNSKKPPQTVNLTYDFANRQRRFDYVADNITIIEKEEHGVFNHYTIMSTGECGFHLESELMGEVGVPSNFSSRTDFTIGGELPVTSFIYPATKKDDSRARAELIFTSNINTSAYKCLPVFTSGGSNDPRETLYRNITLGIRNPAVFHTPANCKPD
jgi:hypothetical protein